MGAFSPGPAELIIILIIVLLLFGSRKLPDMARSMGKSARVFKAEVSEMKEEDREREEAKKRRTERGAPLADDRYDEHRVSDDRYDERRAADDRYDGRYDERRTASDDRYDRPADPRAEDSLLDDRAPRDNQPGPAA